MVPLFAGVFAALGLFQLAIGATALTMGDRATWRRLGTNSIVDLAICFGLLLVFYNF